MTFEEKAFACRRFNREKMLTYGFSEKGKCYVFERDFAEDSFHLILSVDDTGRASGRVIDKMNDEEYMQLRNENFTGAYVGGIRSEYEKILADVSDKCCDKVLFASDQANRIAGMIFERYSVEADFPWGYDPYDANGTFRHKDTGKWFALIMNVKKGKVIHTDDERTVDVINLKSDLYAGSDPDTEGVYRAYHMSHKYWISIILDDTLDDREVFDHIIRSYDLTELKKKR